MTWTKTRHLAYTVISAYKKEMYLSLLLVVAIGTWNYLSVLTKDLWIVGKFHAGKYVRLFFSDLVPHQKGLKLCAEKFLVP